jgi:TIR domain
MPKIVICCRTSDSFGIAGRIFDRLVSHFGRDSVALADLDPSDGAEKLHREQNSARGADVLLATVGRQWLDGIQNDNDPMSSIIGAALSLRIPTIPILVNGAKMPSSEQLPGAIKDFAFRNAYRVDSAQDFEYHLDRLIRTIGIIAERSRSEKRQTAGPDLPPAPPGPPVYAAPVRPLEGSSAAVFISHSSHDRKIAETLVQALESRGLRCWISSRDVAGGDNYQASIVRAIRVARIMLLVFTENANNSEEIKKELGLASRHNLTVIPVRIEDVLPNDALEFELATRQWIDFLGDWERAIDTLSKRISGILAD